MVELKTKDKEKVIRGKKSRAAGSSFETRVRENLEEKGWIVDKWTNNVEIEEDTKKIVDMGKEDFPMMAKSINYGKLIRAKNKWSGPGRPMMMGAGFPDFIAFRIYDEEENFLDTGAIPKKPIKMYEIIGVESKMAGELKKEEKEKCKWLIEQRIFSKILITEKTKVKNKIVIVYHDFKEKYWRFYEKSKD
ncbi:MAG TPA: hypothetical protein VMX17_06275 [Candidatus Glassbacteria bacterium]|nr:hypothetical protein [Candidatus Glassbacteria bacterium]